MSLMCWEADSTNYIPAFCTNTRHSALNLKDQQIRLTCKTEASLVLINLSKLCETFLVLTAWLLIHSVLMNAFLKLKGVQGLPPQICRIGYWLVWAASTWDSAHLERALRSPSFCLIAGSPVSWEKGGLPSLGKAKHSYPCHNGPGYRHLLKQL